jgi:hypothetical protein
MPLTENAARTASFEQNLYSLPMATGNRNGERGFGGPVAHRWICACSEQPAQYREVPCNAQG